MARLQCARWLCCAIRTGLAKANPSLRIRLTVDFSTSSRAFSDFSDCRPTVRPLITTYLNHREFRRIKHSRNVVIPQGFFRRRVQIPSGSRTPHGIPETNSAERGPFKRRIDPQRCSPVISPIRFAVSVQGYVMKAGPAQDSRASAVRMTKSSLWSGLYFFESTFRTRWPAAFL